MFNFGDEKRYISRVLRDSYLGGRVLEVAAGRAEHRDLFDTYVGTDLPSHPYQEEAQLDVYCDARHLPFARGSFKFLFVVAALHQIPGPAQVLKGFYQHLGRGGRLLVFDYTRETQEKWLQNAKENLDQLPYAMWDAPELKSLIEDAGFQDVRRIFPRTIFYHWYKLLRGSGERWLIFRGVKK